MRSRTSLRNRARQVVLLVSAYALMAVGAPLAGALGQPCPMDERDADAAAMAGSAMHAAPAALPSAPERDAAVPPVCRGRAGRNLHGPTSARDR